MELSVKWTEIVANIRTREGDGQAIFCRDGWREYAPMVKHAKKECAKNEAILLDVVAVWQHRGKVAADDMGKIVESKAIEVHEKEAEVDE